MGAFTTQLWFQDWVREDEPLWTSRCIIPTHRFEVAWTWRSHHRKDWEGLRSDVIHQLPVTQTDIRKMTESGELQIIVQPGLTAQSGRWPDFRTGSLMHAFHSYARDLSVHEGVFSWWNASSYSLSTTTSRSENAAWRSPRMHTDETLSSKVGLLAGHWQSGARQKTIECRL